MSKRLIPVRVILNGADITNQVAKIGVSHEPGDLATATATVTIYLGEISVGESGAVTYHLGTPKQPAPEPLPVRGCGSSLAHAPHKEEFFSAPSGFCPGVQKS